MLLNDLEHHPDEYVRAAAAQVLRKYTDDPNVRAALVAAANAPSMEVRRRVRDLTDGGTH